MPHGLKQDYLIRSLAEAGVGQALGGLRTHLIRYPEDVRVESYQILLGRR